MDTEEMRRLRKLGHSYQSIADFAGLSSRAVYVRLNVNDHVRIRDMARAAELRKALVPEPKYGDWSDAEIEYLNANHGVKTFNKMAMELNRSVNAIAGKCHRLGLKLAA